MPKTQEKTTMRISQLSLAPDNPRHEEVDGEMEAIKELCKSENIEVLARDIQLHGMSPSERLIVMPIDPLEDDPSKDQYFIAEGNRRACALKLLHDPELAPAQIRKQIQSYSDAWNSFDDVDVVIIRDAEKRRFWMERIHDGEQGGKGRKRWSAEQKTRFTGVGRNVFSQALLDYAQGEGFLGPEDRQGRISHMSRLVGNSMVKEALGLVTDRGHDDLHRMRSKADFDFVMQMLLDEAKEKRLGSQARKARIDEFVRSNIYGSDRFTGKYLAEPEPITTGKQNSASTGGNNQGPNGDPTDGGPDEGGASGQGGLGRATKPRKRRKITPSSEIQNALRELGNHKLAALYYSLCEVSIRDHPVLIGVGIWSFLESLATLMGSSDNSSFSAFFKPGRIANLGVAKGERAKALQKILEDLGRGGNLSKHHPVAGQFDAEQIMTNFTATEELIVAALKDLKTS